MKHNARSEDPAPYVVNDDHTIQAALSILTQRMRQPGELLGNPDNVKAYLRLKLGGLPHEVFGVAFLDVQNCVIEFEEMFRGTLTQTSVYPREVVLAALRHQASGVILSHNHPSGSVMPSRADELLTQTLRTALALVDVRVLDHIIVTASETLSMAERGLI